MNPFLLAFFGLITGLIDSVVGGGGLISLPVLSWAISPGAPAIGTNKIVGTVGALVALIVYARKGHLLFKAGLMFCVVCAIGSFCGSSLAPHVSNEFFKWLIVSMCPVVLYIVFHPDKFFSEREKKTEINKLVFFISAFGSGFYDGFFGPGGGTFMFLSLYFGTGLPLLNAIAISKLANTFSASTALITYAHNGYVHWREGMLMAIGMIVGSFIGATYATKNAAKIVRPMLAIVVSLLIIKIIFLK